MKHILKLVTVSLFLMNVCLFPQDFQEQPGRKFEFEISGGISFFQGNKDFYSRISGNAEILEQYAQYYGLFADSTGGDIREIKNLYPLNLTLNYKFSSGWFLKMGFEYGFGRTSTNQVFNVSWDNVDEIHQYNYDYKFASLMPFLGIEKRMGNFGIYANVGFNITDFTFTQNFRYMEDDHWIEVEDTYETTGRSIGLSLGAKFMKKIGPRARLLVKLEYFYLDIASFTGTKITNGSNSLGDTYSETVEGTIYAYEIDPYGNLGLDFWDMHAAPPDDPTITGARELGINLSCVRIMIGFSF